jgi:hypothetical protein
VRDANAAMKLLQRWLSRNSCLAVSPRLVVG